MAPTRKRSSLRARTSGAGSTSRTNSQHALSGSSSIFPYARSTPAAPGARIHKRQQKRHALLTRLNKTQRVPSGILKPKKKLQRRRPGRTKAERDLRGEKLLSTLSSLAEALPGSSPNNSERVIVGAGEGDPKGWANEGTTREVGGTKVRINRPIKSLKSKPGSLKKKAKVEKTERERFGMNLAILVGLKGDADQEAMDGIDQPTSEFKHDGDEGSTSDLSARWKTLRNYIKLTL